MTVQELIDFIRSHKAEDAEMLIYHDDLGLFFFPEMRDVKYRRGSVRIDISCADVELACKINNKP